MKISYVPPWRRSVANRARNRARKASTRPRSLLAISRQLFPLKTRRVFVQQISTKIYDKRSATNAPNLESDEVTIERLRGFAKPIAI